MTPLVFKSFLVMLALYWASVYVWDDSAHRKITDLQGHWHSETEGNVTLDIVDTLVIVNRYSRLTTPDTLSIIDRELGRVVLPIPCGCGFSMQPQMGRFTVRDNILTYDSISLHWCYPFIDMRFKRCDPATCHLSHALEPYTYAIDFNQLPVGHGEIHNKLSHPFYSLILIGFTSDDEFVPGPKIQVNDVFISPKGLPQYFELEKQRTERQPMVIWVIDAAIPQTFLEDVFQYVPRDSSTHYQLVTSEDNSQVGYQVMNVLN
jgi:hypothetical protein